MDTTLFIEIDTVIALIVFLFGSVTVVKHGHVAVTTLFGKFRRVLRPGLHFRIPFAEPVFRKLSLQHRSAELEFQAITNDQANVDFKALIIYAVQDEQEETIKRAAFKFIDERSFMQALVRGIEGSIRAFVATKRQSEILGIRREIGAEVKSHIEVELNEWGFHLINLHINDIAFDEAIMRSMAQVVATGNMKAAAENEAQAQFIAKTRTADAEAHARRVVAEAERDADRMRGEGNAAFRRQLAAGLTDADKLLQASGVDHAILLYSEWLEAMKQVAASSHGNILSFDGSLDGFEKTMRQMTALGRTSTSGAPAANVTAAAASGHPQR